MHVNFVVQQNESTTLSRGGRPTKLFELIEAIVRRGNKVRGRDLKDIFPQLPALYTLLKSEPGIVKDTSSAYPTLSVSDELYAKYVEAAKALHRPYFDKDGTEHSGPWVSGSSTQNAPEPKKEPESPRDKYNLPPYPDTADTSATYSYIHALDRAIDNGPADIKFYDYIKDRLDGFLIDLRYQHDAERAIDNATRHINKLRPKDAAPNCEKITLEFSDKIDRGWGWNPLAWDDEYYVRRLDWFPEDKEDASMDEFKAYFNGLHLEPTDEPGEFDIVNKAGYPTGEKVQFTKPYPKKPRITRWSWK